MNREELIEKAKEYMHFTPRELKMWPEIMADFALSVEKEAFKAGFLFVIGHPSKQEWIDKAYKLWKEAEK